METESTPYILEGTLIEIEDSLGIINIPKYDLNIKWPIDELPDVLEIGDIVSLNLTFPKEAEKLKEALNEEKKNEKYDKIRDLLEELVN